MILMAASDRATLYSNHNDAEMIEGSLIGGNFAQLVRKKGCTRVSELRGQRKMSSEKAAGRPASKRARWLLVESCPINGIGKSNQSVSKSNCSSFINRQPLDVRKSMGKREMSQTLPRVGLDRARSKRLLSNPIKTGRGLVCITLLISLSLLQDQLEQLQLCTANTLESAPRITIQPNDLIAIEGESSELNCDAEGQPEPTIEWYHNGQLIKTSTHSRTTMGGSIQFLDIRSPSQSPSFSLSQSASSNSASGIGNGPISSPASKHLQSDAGVYYCLARNSLGQAKSRNATLQVAYIKQEFRAAPKDKLAAIGDTVSFDCLPQAWPEPSIRWRLNGRLIEPSSGQQLFDGSAKYSINKIARTDLNTLEQFGQKLKLLDGDTSNNNNNNNNNHNGSTGGIMVNGEQINDSQLIDVFGSQLVIKQVDKNDEGKYSCLVETKGSHRLIERESPVGQLSALVKPFFIEPPRNQTLEVGGQARLRCRMGGDPEPVISWRKLNGQPLSEKTQIDPIDKTLIMDQLTISDQATYVCEGENSVGSARVMAAIFVNSRPKFNTQPEDQEVDQGARVQFKCAGEASPSPMLFWYKEGHRQLMFAPKPTQSNLIEQHQRLASQEWPQASALVSPPEFRSSQMGTSAPTSDISPSINKLFTMPISSDQFGSSGFSNNYFGNRIYVDNQGALNIVNATTSDSGYYACALISSVGSVLAKARLSVRQSSNSPSDFSDSSLSQDSPYANKGNGKFDLLPPPVIKLGAANQTLPTNTSATLVCEVVSQVAYKIQWFFDSQPLQEEPSRVVVLDTGALSIDNLKTSDSGIYTCVVTAANDQVMPLASPFEPLDSSMLTSAPPIQQSTSHSAMLKVASPMNPNIQFFRMNAYRYPSSPGPAYLVSNNGNDVLTIAWAAPAESGDLPIKEYVIEHYDTSQEHLGWRIIYKIKGKESLQIDGLSSDGSHFFVIRASNGLGTGPSSAIAGPMRTIAGESHYQAEILKRRLPADQRRFNLDSHFTNNMRVDANLVRDRLMTITTNLLSLTPLSSSSIKVQWSTQENGNTSNVPSIGSLSNFPMLGGPSVDNFLEGFSIRFRAVGIGESLLSKMPLAGANWNSWQFRDVNSPSSLPLVTSYLDDRDEPLVRNRRDLDYPQEFNEVRVAERSTEHYTINTLKPFTLYEFFVVPYYKDIDGVPSNIRSAQTNEDRPDIAPPNLTVRPINNTSVRLFWIHVPQAYANGILRSYVVRVNRSDAHNGQTDQATSQLTIADETRIFNIPLSGLTVVPPRVHPNENGIQQYVLMYDLTNLTYGAFYSVQIAAATGVGPGPWSDAQNFVMDPKILSQLKTSGNEIDDVMSKSLILGSPQSYGTHPNIFIIFSAILVIVSILLIIGYLLYQRHNQKVSTWKKTISEHFTNKFYMPSTVDQRGANSIQQNIYDHQQHLIYSGSTHIAQPSLPGQTIWANNGCINSSGTGSLSSHGGLIPISTDPNHMSRRIVGEQALLMNNKDVRLAKNNPGQLIIQRNVDTSRSQHPNHQIIHHSDYYSAINNIAEYDELDPQQRNNMQLIANVDRHQTGSSNSDTSCPSSTTRLLPNQSYNRDLMSKTLGDNQRHEIVLQQQITCNDSKQPFATMVNADNGRLVNMVPLSPYATTNLMNQQSMPQQQLFSNNQMSIAEQSRQHNFVMHNGGVTLDDSSRALMSHQQMNGAHNPMSVFRTLQRNPTSFQARSQQISQGQQPIYMHATVNNMNGFSNQNSVQAQFHQPSTIVANITSNPLADMKSNIYEHIDYSDSPLSQQPRPQTFTQPISQVSNELISSSTSSGSVSKSSSQQQQSDQQQSKFRRGSSNTDFDNEAHDLRVFSRRQDLATAERLNGDRACENNDFEEDDVNQVEIIDETTAFRQKSSQKESKNARQLSKRKRQQQRNRLHNNNQN